MNCEKIKELILTDYIDNEMDDEERIRLNIHFAHCQECKEFFETVRNTVVKPFSSVKKIDSPKDMCSLCISICAFFNCSICNSMRPS